MSVSAYGILQTGLVGMYNLRRKVLSSFSSDLLDDTRRQYGLGKRFTHEYLKQVFGDDYNDKYRNLADLFKRIDALQKMYVEFALTTNTRGASAFKNLKPYLGDHHKKYIDVGCAYGGFVVAFARAGYDAFGLEVDAGLARYGMLNCEDHRLHNRISVGSILDVASDLHGAFDIITCNDVIEHVPDAAKTLAILCQMLSPGGVLNMAIPNKDAISFVTSDGHFQLFGITLLEREYAKQYKFEMTGIEDNYEHMGEYFPLDFYTHRLLQNDLKMIRYLDRGFNRFGIKGMPALLSSLSEAYKRWCANDRVRVSDSLVRMVDDRYQGYCDRLHSDLKAARLSGDASHFISTYLTTFWNIIALKNPTNGVHS